MLLIRESDTNRKEQSSASSMVAADHRRKCFAPKICLSTNLIQHDRKRVMTLCMVILSIILMGDGFLSRYAEAKIKQIPLQMPNVRPDHDEQYLCMSYRFRADTQGDHIIGFQPTADSRRVHHILLYACQVPGVYQRETPKLIWDCKSMYSPHSGHSHHSPGRQDDSSEDDNEIVRQSYERGPVCRGREQIIYAWALDAPTLQLPRGVGFRIGGTDRDMNFLVLQIHYSHGFSDLPSLTDNSGVILDILPNDGESGAITKQAGVLVLVSHGLIGLGPDRHEIWCDLKEDVTIHPMKFRVHTHKLGTQVLGAKISTRSRGQFGYKIDQSEIIGVGDPQAAQMFMPVRDENMTLSKGDTIYAACEYFNNQTNLVNMGNTANDEMCNFYIMYWTDGPRTLSQHTCDSFNAPLRYPEMLP